jgi:hypothetical protein
LSIKNKLGFQSTLRTYIFFSGFLLFIPVFVNFDAHHDGLVLSTVLELKNAIQNGGQWPFNQYGQLWAVPYVLLAFLVPSHYLLIAMRVLTFLYYLATTRLIYKISLRYLPSSRAKIPPLLFLLSQPFALALNSTFLPWPSALCAMLLTAILERLTKTYGSRIRSNLAHFVVGILILVTTGTRLQIGILLLVSVLLLQIVHRRLREALLIFIGFLAMFSLTEIFMYLQGWLVDSVYDSVIFGSQYVIGDTSTYPLPKVTFILSVIIIAVFALFDFIILDRIQLLRISVMPTLMTILATFVSLFLVSLLSDLSISTWTTLFIRRLWISTAISVALYALALLIFKIFRMRLRFKSEQLNLNLMVCISLVSFTQVIPLFDQMHFWWGFSPLVILFTYTFAEQFMNRPALSLVTRPITIALISGLLFANLVGVVNQLNFARTPLHSSIASGVVVNDHTDNEISIFLNHNIKHNSRVLSLCPNSNVFFSVKSTKSAAREFVLWSPTLDLKRYKGDLLNSTYDYIVACPLKGASDTVQLGVNRSINFILNRETVSITNSFLDAHNREWIIYKPSA